MRWVVHYYAPLGRNTKRLVNFYLSSKHSSASNKRRLSLQVILEQAQRQGVKLRVKDLCLLLSSSAATVKRDLRSLKGQNNEGLRYN